MRALPLHASRGQSYLPADLLKEHAVEPETLLAGETSPALLAALAELRSVARRHIETARGLVGAIDPAVLPAFLPVALVGPQLDRMDRAGFDPFGAGGELSQLRRQWILWRAAGRKTI
jgi:phytoene synthase